MDVLQKLMVDINNAMALLATYTEDGYEFNETTLKAIKESEEQLERYRRGEESGFTSVEALLKDLND